MHQIIVIIKSIKIMKQKYCKEHSKIYMDNMIFSIFPPASLGKISLSCLIFNVLCL